MEREFKLNMAEEPSGRVCLCWDDLHLFVRGVCPVRGEGLVKLWLKGAEGRLLLGTLIPERGCLVLNRSLTIAEARRVGAWPPDGVESQLIWPFRTNQPFLRPDLFCFARIEGEWAKIAFREDGWPIFLE